MARVDKTAEGLGALEVNGVECCPPPPPPRPHPDWTGLQKDRSFWLFLPNSASQDPSSHPNISLKNALHCGSNIESKPGRRSTQLYVLFNICICTSTSLYIVHFNSKKPELVSIWLCKLSEVLWLGNCAVHSELVSGEGLS